MGSYYLILCNATTTSIKTATTLPPSPASAQYKQILTLL
jgi:hypothetical protein